MIRKLLALVLYFFVVIAHGQINYKGQILDAKTEQPLPYVNIGIIGKGVGTVSDEEGFFYLEIDRSRYEVTAEIQISSLGYETLDIPISQISTAGQESPKILLRPSEIQLQEVVVLSDALVPITEYLGYRNYGERSFGYWNDNIALGGELATRIRARRGKRQLNSLEFEVWENPSDSVLIRVNIYDTDGFLGRPNTNLNTSQKNIITTLSADREIITIDLNPYEIYVEDDFIVSLELLQVYGDKKLSVVLAASSSTGSSFRRYASQSDWELLSDTHMAYYLETSPYVTQKKASKYESKVERIRAKERMLSGYAIFRGKMISDVSVLNTRTRETVQTDESGRYERHAEKGDIILFNKTGYKEMFLQVGTDQFANAIMKL